MNTNGKISIQAVLLGILGILLLWMLAVIINASILKNGLLEVVDGTTCELRALGITEKGRMIYSYCLEEVVLDKVKNENGIVLESLLLKDLKEKDCLWDGGTCTYVSKTYQIISCQKEDKTDLIITNKKITPKEAYDRFCGETTWITT